MLFLPLASRLGISRRDRPAAIKDRRIFSRAPSNRRKRQGESLLRRLFALVLWLSALAPPAGARPEGEIIVGAKSDCARPSSPPVKLKTLINNYPDHAGGCVSTEGYFHANALFRRRADSFRHRAQSSGAMARRRIGVYASDENLAAMQALKGERLRLFGSVSDCRSFGGDADLVLGYCHYAGGPILLVSSFERAP